MLKISLNSYKLFTFAVLMLTCCFTTLTVAILVVCALFIDETVVLLCAAQAENVNINAAQKIENFPNLFIN